MATLNGETLVLSSGRELKLLGALFINYDLEIGQAYITNILKRNRDATFENSLSPVSNPYGLSADEVNEIADFHISLWMRLKENIRHHGMATVEIFRK